MKKIFITCMSLYCFISIRGQDQILKYEVNNVGELQYNIADAREKRCEVCEFIEHGGFS